MMGNKAPEYWVSLDEMREEGLPQTFDYLRFQKGANDYPFICIHTDDQFYQMLSLEDVEWPGEIPTAETPWKLKEKMLGVFQMVPTKSVPEVPQLLLDENGQPLPPLTEKELFLDHLDKMKNQKLNLDAEERTFRRLVSRKFLEKQTSFSYSGDLDFSVLQMIADSNPGFPRKWNLNDLPGPLKEICSEETDGRNEVRGVSTSMTYAGKKATYSAMHVEDLDYASANVLLPWSAGKAWVGIHPGDQHILDEYIRTEFRRNCVSPMLHKDIILDLDLLDSLGIRWYYFIQRPGDIIITNPAAPHQIVNLGFNLAEATNFYTHRHLVAARRRNACQCPSRLARYDADAWKRLATFVYSGEFKFLCKTNGVEMPEPGEILTQLMDEAENLRDTLSSSQTWLQENPTIADAIASFTRNILGKDPGNTECEPSVELNEVQSPIPGPGDDLNPVTKEPLFGEICNYDVNADRLTLKTFILDEFDESTHCYVVFTTENVIEVPISSLLCPEPVAIYRKSKNYIRMPYALP